MEEWFRGSVRVRVRARAREYFFPVDLFLRFFFFFGCLFSVSFFFFVRNLCDIECFGHDVE